MNGNILPIYKLQTLIIALLIITVFSIIMPLKNSYAKSFDLLKGNRLYKSGLYSDAFNKYRSAIKKQPENYKAIFNAGDTLYKLENYTTAIDYYRRALQKSKTAKIKSMIYYNIGNSFYKLGKYEEAVKEYLKSLALNPYNQKVKQNLELAAEKLKKKKNNKAGKEQPSQVGKNNNNKNNPNPAKKKSKKELPTTKPEQQKTGKALTENEAKEILKSFEEKNQYQLQQIIKNRLNKESNNEKGW